MSNVTRFVRAGITVAIMSVLGWLGGCSDSPSGPCPDCPPEGGLMVSDTVSALSVASAAGASPTLTSSTGDEVAYVSLPPGTVPAGNIAIIRRVGDAGSIFTTLRDGGFDPVPVDAGAGDSIDVIVRNAAGGTVLQTRLTVAATRPPIVVRTNPPRKKRDVPLNAAIVIVFSEPVAGGTLTSSSVRLFRGTTTVAGTVRLLEGTGTLVAFVPTARLLANTPYRLEVTRAVTDLDGDALASGVTIAFTTGQSSTGPAASIALSPDTVFMTGATYQMTATVRDAAGNLLIDQPITWSTDDPAGLSVSSTGLVTALAAGSYYVTASVNGLSAAAFVRVSAGPQASMTVAPTQATVGAAGDTIILTATVRDAVGRLLDYPSVAWTSSDAAVATVAPDGAGLHGLAFATVTGVSLGSVVVTAASGTASATASITVTPPPPVASLTVSPASASLPLRATTQLSVTLWDANGRVLTGRRSVSWSTSDAAVATVDTAGLVTAVGAGSALVSAASEGVSDTAAITVTTLSFRSVSAGNGYTCALTVSGAAYCWGSNGGSWVWSDSIVTVPVAVSGGHTFSSLSAGTFRTCGVATNGAAYCWLDNPQPVAGGLAFSAVTVGSAVGTDYLDHTCGLTTSGDAYCWGANSNGQLGIGYAVGPEVCDGWSCSTTPRAVIGGLTFSRLSAGHNHTCGLATNGRAYCWGINYFGQLGIGSATGPEECIAGTACSTRPVLVAGGLTFSELDVGFEHTCGLTAAGAAYCWGDNGNGQLGNGSTVSSSVPVAVGGGLTFSALSAGHLGQTCGLTTAGTAYCWGWFYGSLPVAVPGGLTFSALSTGGGHSCGMTVAGILYCWGSNGSGALGDGSLTDSNVPVKVAGQP
ncbi:MAG TPA: Ig-like domain-containing protein [Gemmatimonadales bacterium]|nr:Ig-like domain-containing protein [Gemmatimonadales bacterium]